MGIFKKDEVYDYTLLQKKGYLKVPAPKKSAGKVTKDGYVELGLEEMAEQKPSEFSSKNAFSNVNNNPMSIFDNIQSSSSTLNSNPLASFDSFGNIGGNEGGTIVPGLDVKDLSVKLEDFEYKLARIADKLAMIESKLQDFESKFS